MGTINNPFIHGCFLLRRASHIYSKLYICGVLAASVMGLRTSQTIVNRKRCARLAYLISCRCLGLRLALERLERVDRVLRGGRSHAVSWHFRTLGAGAQRDRDTARRTGGGVGTAAPAGRGSHDLSHASDHTSPRDNVDFGERDPAGPPRPDKAWTHH